MIRLTLSAIKWIILRTISASRMSFRTKLSIARSFDRSAVPARFAFAYLAIYTISVSTSISTSRNIASTAFPTIITLTEIRFQSNSIKARWIADCLRTINTCPTVEAVASFRISTKSINTIRTNG